VRLTMGGEPTFISLDNADGDEWTRDAMGPAKRKLAVALLGKLRDSFRSPGAASLRTRQMVSRRTAAALGAVLLLAQGWSRRLGESALDREDAKDYGYTSDDALRFLDALTRRLQVEASIAMPAYEDTFYYLWKERRLPVNVDPLDPKFEDPIERERVARIFEEGLGKLIGYVLPLRRITTKHATQRWTSQPWFSDRKIYFSPPATHRSDTVCRSSLFPGPSRKMFCIPSSLIRLPARRSSKAPARKPDLFLEPPVTDDRHPVAKRTQPLEKGESAPWWHVPRCAYNLATGSCLSSCRR